MVEKILIGVIVISIVGLWLELKKSVSWNPHEDNRRIAKRRLKNKEKRIERKKRKKAGSETNDKI
jgi:hypothetical protein